MMKWLSNIWNAQRNARGIAEYRFKYSYAVDQLHEARGERDCATAQHRDLANGLVMTLAVEYRKAIGSPEALPDSIKEAHALRGFLTGWKYADDSKYGRKYYDKTEASQRLASRQHQAALLYSGAVEQTVVGREPV